MEALKKALLLQHPALPRLLGYKDGKPLFEKRVRLSMADAITLCEGCNQLNWGFSEEALQNLPTYPDRAISPEDLTYRANLKKWLEKRYPRLKGYASLFDYCFRRRKHTPVWFPPLPETVPMEPSAFLLPHNDENPTYPWALWLALQMEQYTHKPLIVLWQDHYPTRKEFGNLLQCPPSLNACLESFYKRWRDCIILFTHFHRIQDFAFFHEFIFRLLDEIPHIIVEGWVGPSLEGFTWWHQEVKPPAYYPQNIAIPGLFPMEKKVFLQNKTWDDLLKRKLPSPKASSTPYPELSLLKEEQKVAGWTAFNFQHPDERTYHILGLSQQVDPFVDLVKKRPQTPWQKAAVYALQDTPRVQELQKLFKEDTPEGAFLLARIYGFRGDKKKERAYFEKARLMAPSSEIAYLATCWSDLPPPSPPTPWAEGQYYRFLGYQERKLTYFERWCQLSLEKGWYGQVARAYSDMAKLHGELGDLSRAENALRQACRYAQYVADHSLLDLLHFNLGDLLMQQGKLRESEAIYRQLDPEEKSREVVFQKGWIDFYRGFISRARKKLQKIHFEPSHTFFHPYQNLVRRMQNWESETFKDHPYWLPWQKEAETILLSKGEKAFYQYLKVYTIHHPMESALFLWELKYLYPEKLDEKKLKKTVKPIWEKAQAEGWLSRIKIWDYEGAWKMVEQLLKGSFPENLTEPHAGWVSEEDPHKETIFRRGGKAFQVDQNLFHTYPPVFWNLLPKILPPGEEPVVSLRGKHAWYGFVYASPKIAEMIASLEKVARLPIPILITGETGTGKEVLAKAIHRASPFRTGNFVALHCAAIPENLLEAELFGYRQGAFTGANQDKPGLIEQAHGGTLFLDEVGEIPLSVQVKLLRVLQEQEVQRLGDLRKQKVSFRLISATHRDVAKLVEQGAFREDFYYRIKGWQVMLPPLRERMEDLPVLADHLIQNLASQFSIPPKSLSEKALFALLSHPWQGNVRELEHLLMVALAHSQERECIELEDLPAFSHRPPGKVSLRQLTKLFKQNLVYQALKEAKGDRKRAAQKLDVSLQTLHNILNQM